MNASSRRPIPGLLAAVFLVPSAPAWALDVAIRVPEPDTLTLLAVAFGAGVLAWRNLRNRK